MADLDAIFGKLDTLNVSELGDLVSKLEDAWNVKAISADELTVSLPQTEEVVAAKTTFDVELTSYGPKKIQVIKAIRPLLNNLPLREAKELVERAPVVLKEELGETDALEMKRVLEEVGAVVTLL